MSRTALHSRYRLASVGGAAFVTPVVVLAALMAAAPTAWAAPSTPSALAARPGDGVVQLTWSGGGGAGVLIRALAGTSAPASPTDGREVFRGTGTTARDSGLTDGTAYSYAVWGLDADGTTSGTAAPVTVTPVPAPATRIDVAAPAAVVPAGSVLTVSGQLLLGDGSPLPGEAVTLVARTLGTGVTLAAGQATSGSDGAVSYRLAPRASAQYQLVFAGSPFGAPSTGGPVTSRVQPALTASLTVGSVVLGTDSVLHGALTPAYAGARLAVQRLLAGGWHTAAVIGTGAGGGYRIGLRPGVIGTVTLRVVLAGTDAYESATSPTVRLRVDARDLHPGDVGGDVLAMEQRLAALRYHFGAPTGVFDAEAAHALTAFQKLAGLPVSGFYDRGTRARLATAGLPAVRFPAAGIAVEVDITHQVVIVSQGGVPLGVLDTSTGSDRLYVSDGITYRATTPRGHFQVTWKFDGIRVSRLGQLYRPAYFVQGWAIHGSNSVPTYPASHGCIRVTDPSMDWLFPILPTGAPVTLYDS
ncbi:MAG: L,D-transpeptidase family protein [Actinomycetota bacterium]|nr:L,D-transpeptidase family protein [Actinomycetota bacterium]